MAGYYVKMEGIEISIADGSDAEITKRMVRFLKWYLRYLREKPAPAKKVT